MIFYIISATICGYIIGVNIERERALKIIDRMIAEFDKEFFNHKEFKK